MNKQQVLKRLLPLVANEQWARLEDYLNFRREELGNTLETSTDIRTINKTQGKVELLKEILNLSSTISSIK